MFGKTSDLEAVFTNVNGLQLGNNVRYSGKCRDCSRH
jgi:phospholipid/cholesterol/gamma-HCH transport system substrate-binding protein